MSSSGMRIAIGQFNELTDEKLKFAAQLGVTGVQMNTPRLPGEARWEAADVRALVDKCAEYGLTMEAIENVPIHFFNKAMLGLPGRDEQIENYQATIRAIGQAGIPILGYAFMPNSVWRTARAAPGRGGAAVTAFDMALVSGPPDQQRAFVAKLDERKDAIWVSAPDGDNPDRVFSAEEMWANYDYFIKAVIPVAEEAGVKLALHPDDPPVPMLGGIARIFGSIDGFKRAHEITPSPAWGLDLCFGCCSEMPGGAQNVFDMIDFFGPLGKILYVHYRDVKGTLPSFAECFLGEGNYDPAAVMLALKRTGFTGFMLDDHVPHIVDDTPWAHRGRAHAIGYLQGMMNMLEHVSA